MNVYEELGSERELHLSVYHENTKGRPRKQLEIKPKTKNAIKNMTYNKPMAEN